MGVCCWELRVDEKDVQTEVLKRMSPGQRLKAAMRLYWSARRLKAGWIRQHHPDWTKEQVEKAVREAFGHARA